MVSGMGIDMLIDISNTMKPTKATLKKVPPADCGRYDAFRRILIFVTS